LIEKAFRKIDKDSNGFLEVDDIKELYNAKRHPDVI
jgi:Ca2+-binding EF-hand superfamily protein